MAATRIHFLFMAVACVLLLLGLGHQHQQVKDTFHRAWENTHSPYPVPSWLNNGGSPTPSPELPTFHEIATKWGTDKVNPHQYWYFYDKYLPAFRHKKIKMLEIGLGCNMDYGPGKSYYTWLEYFPNVELYYMDYDAACVQKWVSEVRDAKIYTGDQADPAFLQRFITESGGNFDIIIDDGGHSTPQQKTSLEYLWSIVKPGGIYFLEDLQTSFLEVGGGDPSGGRNPNIHTMLKMVYELIDDLIQPDGTRHAISRTMRSIECGREMCAFFKKDDAVPAQG